MPKPAKTLRTWYHLRENDMNLLEETISMIAAVPKNIKDIEYIGNEEGTLELTWSRFKEVANFEYDAGYGGNEIASDLVIVFKDGTWLSRAEYDGSEWWHYNIAPTREGKTKAAKSVRRRDYRDCVE